MSNFYKVVGATSIVVIAAILMVTAVYAQPRAIVVTPLTEFRVDATPPIIRPQARPSDFVEIDNHWLWAHEFQSCDVDSGPLCIIEAPNQLSDTDLAVIRALGGEDIWSLLK